MPREIQAIPTPYERPGRFTGGQVAALCALSLVAWGALAMLGIALLRLGQELAG